MSNFNKNRVAIAITLAISSAVYAENQTKQEQDGGGYRLPEIVVYANQNNGLSSIQTLTQDDIKKTPSENSNITDYLKSNPHVRYEHSDQDGFTRGEIKPENISINGADENQTAYFVDNVNVNNDLGVDSEVFDGAIQVVPGVSHTQAYFFDPNMLSRVELQDSNISASLGGFMGGAVVAKTKQYSGKDGVKLNYRTTNSHWAKMNIEPNAQKVLSLVRPDSNGDAILQPKYHKNFFSIVAEKELTPALGMVIGFNRKTSHIEQNRLIGYGENLAFDKQDHLRQTDTGLLNFNWTPDDKNRIELGLRYSNYKEEKYFADNLDSNLADYHQAYGGTLAWVKSFDSGVLTNTLAYDLFKDKRKSSSNHVESVSVLDDQYEPLYNYEKGGYGNSLLTQRNLHFSTEYALNAFDWGAVNHSISVGGIYQATQYRFQRDQDVYNNIKTIIKTIVNGLESSNISNFTPKGKVKTNYQNIVFYAEDLISWKNLEFRPGIRLERDDYLKNTNIAPRFVASYSPWAETTFNLGLNRYYGRSFAPLKLSGKILSLNQDTSRKHQDFSKLKTPYADELSVGLQQTWRNLALKLNYIHRQNKDRIVLRKYGEEDKRYSIYENGQNYNVDVYTLQLNNIAPWKLGKTEWRSSIAFDWLNTKRADLHNDYDPNEPVYLDGKLTHRAEMLRKVNSSKEDWMLRLGLDMDVPDYNITWANRVSVKAPVRYYTEIDGEFDDKISRFRGYHYGKHIQWDSSIRWQPKIAGQHSVYVKFDILNVLNKTRKGGARAISSTDEYSFYSPGREFWLEVGYEF